MGTNKQIMILDPSSYVDTVELGLAPRTGDLRGKKVGLLDDGLAHSDALLERIGELLEESHEVGRVIQRQKPNLSLPAPATLFNELVEEVDFMIVGVGG